MDTELTEKNMNNSTKPFRKAPLLCDHCVLCGKSLLVLLFISSSAFAQTWPAKSLRVVVPFTAASATDTVARIVAERLTQQFGQTLVVENRPGAGGTTSC